VCGDAVIYFNPYDIENRIYEITFDTVKYNQIKERGIQRYSEIKQQQNTMLDDLCDIILRK